MKKSEKDSKKDSKMKIHLDPFKAALKNIEKELEGLEEGFYVKIHLDPFKAALKNIGKELEGLEEGF